MKDSNRSTHFICATSFPANYSSVDFETKGDLGGARSSSENTNFFAGSGPGGKSENVSFATNRCSEKGCVFPASPERHGKCSYHWHEQQEPVLFRSHQPTGLLLDPARSLPAEQEYEGSRKRDRRRLANLWEQFQNEGTP